MLQKYTVRILGLLALAYGGGSCSRIDIRELAAFPDASQMAGPERPRLFYDNAFIPDSMPTLVPYALLVLQRGAGVPVDSATRQLWWKAQDLKADAIRVVRPGYTFNDPALLEFGSSLTDQWQKVVAREYGMLGICLRRAPCKLDLRLDEGGSLLKIMPELAAQGVERWDRLLAVNEVRVDVSNRLQSRHLAVALKAKPGQELRMTWERPGGGIRETVIKPAANIEFPTDVLDSLVWRERNTE